MNAKPRWTKPCSKWQLLSAIGLVLSICADSVAAQQIELFTEVLPPFQSHDAAGKGQGFSFDLVEQICSMTKDCKTPAFVPWSRAVATVKERPNTALFSMYRKPEQEKDFQWVGPLTSANIVFLGLAGRGLKVTSMEDAKKLGKIGVQADSSHHKRLMALGFGNLELTSTTDEAVGNTNIHKLMAGRFDAWIATEQSARAKAKILGIPDQQLETLYVISQDKLFIAFNVNTPASTIARWQKALDEIKARPAFDALRKKHGVP